MPDELMARIKKNVKEYAKALGAAVLIALFIRSFGFEAFKIPSGSMLPTLSIGDHIFVNKFIYGFRVPLTRFRFWEFTSPKRGDVIVFIYPADEGKDFIKRVVGLPSDRIRIEDGRVSINGRLMEEEPVQVSAHPSDRRRLVVKELGKYVGTIPYEKDWDRMDFFVEDIEGREHLVQYERFDDRGVYELTVPPKSYFVMGDNRDNSADSREWGVVPDGNIKGKAMFVWLPLDKDLGWLRWHEFGRWIK